MKDKEQKKVNQGWDYDQDKKPNKANNSCAGYREYPLEQAVSKYVEQSSENGIWEKKAQPARSNIQKHKYYVSGAFLHIIHEFRVAVHSFSNIYFVLGTILITIGTIVWLSKLLRGQKCNPLEPFEPVKDTVGVLFFYGIVFVGIGFIFRVL